MPADVRERLFSKFARGGAHSLPGTQGAGLGLAISRQIMQRLGGTLELVQGSARGACFRVQLPRVGHGADPNTIALKVQ